MEFINADLNLLEEQTDKIAEQGRIYLSMLHDHLIKGVLPILNQMHRFLRDNKSPLQSDLRNFFRVLVKKHPTLLDELRRQEPLLAAELEHDISLTESAENSPIFSPPSTNKPPFISPLLSKIATTPNMTLIAPPEGSPYSPISLLSQPDSNIDPGEKRPPIPFNLEEDD